MIALEHLKVGNILIAINECIMEDSGIPALKIGKKYIIKEVDFRAGYNFIAIGDSEYNIHQRKLGRHLGHHGFRIRDLDKFFKIK